MYEKSCCFHNIHTIFFLFLSKFMKFFLKKTKTKKYTHFIFSLMNALVYVDIDQSIHWVKNTTRCFWLIYDHLSKWFIKLLNIQNGTHFFLKQTKNVTFCVMKYSSSKKIFAAQFYHSKTWLKVKIKNKSAKKMNKSAKKWTSLQKNEQFCKKKMNKSAKNYMGYLKECAPPSWFAHFENKPKTSSHRHHKHIFHQAVSQSNVKRRVKK